MISWIIAGVNTGYSGIKLAVGSSWGLLKMLTHALVALKMIISHVQLTMGGVTKLMNNLPKISDENIGYSEHFITS